MKPFNCLLLLSLFDAILNGWVSVWWAKSFLKYVDQYIFSVNEILQATLGIISLFFVIRRVPKPKLSWLYCAMIVSYSALLFMFISYNVFFIAQTCLTAMYFSLGAVFGTTLINNNINQNERKKFDDNRIFITKIGLAIGASISLITLLKNVDPLYVWLGIYIAYDLDFFVKTILIRKNILEY